MIRRCPEHGYYDADRAETCDCGEEGDAVLSDERRIRLSKFMSGALRHFPDDAGIALDAGGWTQYDAVVEAVVLRYGWARPEHVNAVVETDPKGRFERDDESGRIRAAYGHSVDVELDAGSDDHGDDGDTPETLYHGTARRNVAAIREKGVVPKERQEVYLSHTVEEAREVGARHGDSVVFEVDTEELDVTRRGDGVYAVKSVPSDALSLVERGT